ncbi:MAG: 16S rRNA (uracil(1498)-N(3))-methyltransferase [Methylococcales bacterium]|nr:16S rRNA (uracil(1498)-N(3))-methyltransferase [Methylococcales bacterium]
MRIPRIYLPVALSLGAHVELDDVSAHHVRSVLRLKKGHSLSLFDGEGFEYGAVLVLVSKKSVTLEVESAGPCDTESRLVIYLGLGISRGERMDFAIQKSVELGVAGVSPLFTERTVVKVDTTVRALQKQSHWQKVAQHASEQSGRAKVPEVNPPQPLLSWLKQCSGLKLFLDPLSTRSLGDLDTVPDCVSLLSGPEGGFSPLEREQAFDAGFTGICLGPRILRTETAVLAGVALLQATWGDLGFRG